MAFDRPDAPGRDPDAPQFILEDHVGDLLVIQPQSHDPAFKTEYGERPLVVADVHVIDPAGTIRETFPEAWLFGTVLHSQLRQKMGRTVLGVLEQGQKQPGKKPPWRLADPTDAQEAVALRAMASKPDAPEEQAPEPKPDPWAQPAAAAAGGKAPWE